MESLPILGLRSWFSVSIFAKNGVKLLTPSTIAGPETPSDYVPYLRERSSFLRTSYVATVYCEGIENIKNVEKIRQIERRRTMFDMQRNARKKKKKKKKTSNATQAVETIRVRTLPASPPRY
jgi:hypothetical protein